MANPDMPDKWQCLTLICVTGEKLNPQPHLRPHQRLDLRLRLRPKLRLQLRLGITPTGTGTGTLIMVMAMGATMAAIAAMAAMADITMANRFQEFQSLIFEKFYYETIEHWREIWT